MNSLDKLIQHFESFPGVGARQAQRFAFHILTMGKLEATELANLIGNIKSSVVECTECHRFFVTNQSKNACSICTNQNRDQERLLVVERDSDVTALERAGVYDGQYFVLGGTVPLLKSSENEKLRSGALKRQVAERSEREPLEVILGFSVNPDGENTARFVESILSELIKDGRVTLTHLGRGLSTGSELEYADVETLKSALKNRF